MPDAFVPGEGAAKKHRTVSRVMTILELVAAAPDGITLATMVRELDAAKSSIHGLVKGLVAIGYLSEEDGTYRLGPAVTFLLAPGGPGLELSARPVMKQLQRDFDETVMLATRIGDSVTYIDTVESTQLIRYSAPLKVRRPMWPTSTGKCFLAHLGDARRASYLRDHFSSQSERESAAAELAEVRRNGYAVNRGETLPDISAVASPIVTKGRVLACLAIAGPSPRFGPSLDAAADAVCAAARQFAVRA